MALEKQIKITKKDGTFHIVPATQRNIYEAFNAKNTKLKKLTEVVTIEDYEAPAEDQAADKATAASTHPDKKTAAQLIELIKKATTKEEIAAIVGTDERVSVLKAAEDQAAELGD